VMGITGRMLYKSKSMKKPTTIFNANIFNAEAKKIWFGDLEIELRLFATPEIVIINPSTPPEEIFSGQKISYVR
ncbi:MAG: hypothetical protein HGA55_00355, partial [Methanoregulaceae archaeon]|nr:hypothetical protein [Methanoregulaceae archaeon]